VSIEGKTAKYLSPQGQSSRLILLRVTWEIGLNIAQRSGYERSYRDRLVGARVSDLRAEDPEFWQWIIDSKVPITLVEGEKKAGCLLSRGYAAIALPGITGGVRTKDKSGKSCLPRLISDLEPFATPDREIVVCFDYEPRQQQLRALELEIEKLHTCFAKTQSKVKIISLPGPAKGVDDFVVAQGADAFHSLAQAAAPFEQWQSARYGKLTHPVSLELNQRYLGVLPIPASAKLIGIKSPKGTGKTESYVEIVTEAIRSGQRVLLISHRVQLAQAICDRIGIPYLTEVRSSGTGDLLGYGLCVDSLHPESAARFDGSYWSEAIIILDESEQVIWHTLSATTEINNRRIPVLKELQKLFTGVLESDRGRIFVSDADLSDLTIECIWGLAAQKPQPYIIVNRWQPNQDGWNVHHYPQRQPDQWLAALDEHVANGGRPFIVTQAQKAKSRWSTCTLEGWLRKRYPDKRILRIDSQTIADPTHEAYLCTSKLNELLVGYDVVVASPSIETGVSIDIRGHFTSVWGVMQGVTPADSARQSLARVREPVDRHIWIARYGLGRVGSGSTSVRSLLRAEHELARMNTRLLEFVDHGDEMLTAHGVALRVWAKMACRINAGLIRYRDTILAGLQTEGHWVADVVAIEKTDELMQSVTDLKTEQHGAECEAIAQAEDITPKQYDELKGKKTKTKADYYKERKHTIQNRYQSEVTPDLVAKDDDGWYSQIRLYYYLIGGGRPHLRERDRQAFELILSSGGIWLPTLNRSQLGVQVGVLEKLQVSRLLDSNRDYKAADADLQEMAAMAKQYRYAIKLALGITIAETDTPIAIAQMLLSKLGLKLTYDRKEGKRGESKRVYRYHRPKDGRDEIVCHWLERDAVNCNSAVSTPGISKEIPTPAVVVRGAV
jgi:hypothetical protein